MKIKKITKKQFEKMKGDAQKAIASIPKAHNRKREEAENDFIIEKIKKSKKEIEIAELLNKKINLIHTGYYNQGTKKWVHNILVYYISHNVTITGETPCYYKLSNNDRIAKDKIIACYL